MAASDRDKVNQSNARPASAQTHARQAPVNRSTLKKNNLNGRDLVRQSPPTNRTTD
jgi:hypothetical protein